MDPILNPYAPGAGTPPPELAGRDELREFMRIALARVIRGKPSKSTLLVGLRGVGKTVLLDQLCEDALEQGVLTAQIEAPEQQSLPALLAPELRLVLLKLSRLEKAKDGAQRALRALAGFAGALKVTYNDIEVGLDFEPEPGLADNGELERDLKALLEQIGIAAQKADTAVAIFTDELQYVPKDQLAALISALHLCARRRLPVILVGAGLPQLIGRTGRAKSYAERLFQFTEIGPLPDCAARQAIIKPAAEENVTFTEEAVDEILAKTESYPYFLQEWGKHAWEVASESPITRQDVEEASTTAIAELDGSFFSVRFDRLKPSERRYLRAMAELGPGSHRSGEIADCLGRTVNSLAPTRHGLIESGMVWSPSHGDTAFTVPLFDEFMRRRMPGDDWKTT